MNLDWLTGSAPFPNERYQCDGSDCTDSRVFYLFHEPNKSIYKCCYGCFRAARSVSKKEFREEISGAYSDFQKAREDHWRKKSEEKRKRIWEELAERESPEEFYASKPWLRVRYQALAKHFKKYGHMCLCCKRKYVPLHVDHVKPRSKYPELSLDLRNLQVLCADCNIGKSNVDETDFREPAC